LQEPLRKIQTFAGRIIETESKNFTEKGKQYFDRINNAAERMKQLIEDLLSYSRTNTTEIEFIPSDLNRILDEVTGQIREVNEKMISIHSQKLPVLAVIPGQIAQLFSNIISNAIKYSKPDQSPQIDIEVSQVRSIPELTSTVTGQFWRIDFKDNGIGFSNEYKHRIFELFQRLHTRQEFPGTGLGLAICKKIMMNHHGHITANGTPGEGAVFSLYFPV